MKYSVLLLFILAGLSLFAQKKSNVQKGSRGLIIGNSTIATYACGHQIGKFLFTSTDSLQGNTYRNQAVPGDSISGQMTLFKADVNKHSYVWVIVEIGLNDLDPEVGLAATIKEYQNLINVIRSDGKSGVKIIVSSMTPCRQRLIDLYGPTKGEGSYQKWLKMNLAILGKTAYKIKKVDYRIKEHVALLSDGNGNLSPEYDCGDHIHENDTARAIIASAWRKALNELGYLEKKTD